MANLAETRLQGRFGRAPTREFAMWRWWIAISIVPALSAAGDPASAGVYVNESFSGATASGWSFTSSKSGPVPYLTADSAHKLDAAGSGWLRLTENVGYQGTAAFTDSAFKLTPGAGIRASFDFAAYNGTGADGLTFTMLDGSAAKPSAGGFGGSMGYADRSYVDGVAGGYLSVGFDELGNFSNPTEGRNGGPGGTPNAIAVRGAGNGQTGYAYITGTKNLGSGFLDYRSLTTRPSQLDSHFRHATILLQEKSPTELLLTVLLQRGVGTTPVAYINNFNILGTFGGTTQKGLPSSMRFGFTAGTGALSEIHEVRNLVVGTFDSYGTSDGKSVSTPEPTTWVGAALGVAGLFRRRLSPRSGRSEARPPRS